MAWFPSLLWLGVRRTNLGRTAGASACGERRVAADLHQQRQRVPPVHSVRPLFRGEHVACGELFSINPLLCSLAECLSPPCTVGTRSTLDPT